MTYQSKTCRRIGKFNQMGFLFIPRMMYTFLKCLYTFLENRKVAHHTAPLLDEWKDVQSVHFFDFITKYTCTSFHSTNDLFAQSVIFLYIGLSNVLIISHMRTWNRRNKITALELPNWENYVHILKKRDFRISFHSWIAAQYAFTLGGPVLYTVALIYRPHLGT